MSFELPDPHRDEDGARPLCWLCSDEGCGLCRPVDEVIADIDRRIKESA